MSTPNDTHTSMLRVFCVVLSLPLFGCGPTIIIIDGEDILDVDEDADSTDLDTEQSPDIAGCATGTVGCDCVFDGSCDDGLMCSEVGTCYEGVPCGASACVEGYGCTLADTCIDCAFNLGVYGCSCNISGECEGTSACDSGMCSGY